MGDIKEEVSITKMMYGWSKYGGPRHGLVKKNIKGTWACQACAQQQTEEMPRYMYEFAPQEYVRVCGMCHFIGFHLGIQRVQELIPIVRPKKDVF